MKDKDGWEKKLDGFHFDDPELGSAMVAFPFPITQSWEWHADTKSDNQHAWGENIASEKEAKLRAILFLETMRKIDDANHYSNAKFSLLVRYEHKNVAVTKE